MICKSKFILYVLVIHLFLILNVSYAIDSKKIFLQIGHESQINQICFSTDSKFLISSGVWNKIKLWSIEHQFLIKTYNLNELGLSFQYFNTNGKQILLCEDSSLFLLKVKDSSVRALKGHSDVINTVCFSPDGRFAASGSADKTIKIWNLNNAALMNTLKGHSSSINSLSFSPDSRFIVSGSDVSEIMLWSVKDGTLKNTLKGHSSSIDSVSFSPDGRVIVSKSYGIINLWNVKDGNLINTFKGLFVDNLFFSLNGSLMGIETSGSTLNLWDVEDANIVKTFKGHSEHVRAVDFSLKGSLIASGDDKGTIKVWKIKDGTHITLNKGFNNPDGRKNHELNFLRYSPDGNFIATGNCDSQIKLWNVETGVCLKTLKGAPSRMDSLSFSSDGKYIASGSAPMNIIWNVSTGNLINEIHDGLLNEIYGDSFQFSKTKGNKFSTGAVEGWIRHYSIKENDIITKLSEKLIFEEDLREDEDDRGCFSPDSKQVALIISMGDYISSIYICSTKKVQDCIYTKEYINEEIDSLCFSPKGKFIAAAIGYQIFLWNTENLKLCRTFKGHTDYVDSVDFSPDGKYIASGSSDGSINLWSSKDGTLINTFKTLTGIISCVCFSPDGKHIAYTEGDNIIIRAWNSNEKNDFYIYASLPENEWISYKSDQLFYNSSSKGDKYAAIRFNNDIFNYAPLSSYRKQYKRSFLFHQPKTKKTEKVQIKLLCTFEGKQFDAFDIDEEINVFTSCRAKNTSFQYNNELKSFIGHRKCPNFHIHTYKFEPKTTYPVSQHIIEMNFNKPILYVLINPSTDLDIQPLNFSEQTFEKMKNQLRSLSDKLDNNDKYRFWHQRWFRTYFYSQHLSNNPILLNNSGIFATKWNDSDFIKAYNQKISFNNKGITYQQLINDVCKFFDGFSISNNLSVKGAALIIIGAPKTFLSNTEIESFEQKLRKKNYCALIAQFGKKENNLTSNGNLKNLKIIELNLEKEFYDRFFQGAFEKIHKAFEALIEKNIQELE